MKLKTLSKQLHKVFRLSEDYDSDSDASDADNKIYRKGYKAVSKHLKAESMFETEDKIIKLK